MIKYITNYRTNCIKFDTETEEVSELEPDRNTGIDWIYIIDEDGEFTMDGVTKAVKKNDIVLKFYKNEDRVHPFAVIRSKEIKQNNEAVKKASIERAKKYAANAETDNACCDACNPKCC